MIDAEEKDKARALVDYYRICFAHPFVEGIMMWVFGGRQLDTRFSLYKRDWTRRPPRMPIATSSIAMVDSLEGRNRRQ